MSSKNLIRALFAVILIGLIVWFFSRPYLAEPAELTPVDIRVLRNAVLVDYQTVAEAMRVRAVVTTEPAFVVIHEDVRGVPGEIVGVSGLMPVGETRDVRFRPVAPVHRGVYWAILRHDDGDQAYQPSKDRQARDSRGETAAVKFKLKAE